MPMLRLFLALCLVGLAACAPAYDPTGPASEAAIADAMATPATMPAD